MSQFSQILLASHNTRGAQAAEQLAFELAIQNRSQIHHLIVVPDFWQWMTGDDWLNNAHTQKEYGDYVESELDQEIQRHIVRLQTITKESDIPYQYLIIKGKPNEVLIEKAAPNSFNLVVMGSPRPKGVEGLNSKMLTKSVPTELQLPLLIAPFPKSKI